MSSADLCRLVVVGPERQAEIAVPSQVAVADLLPALLPHLGERLSDAGLAHGGWVLQRLGEPAFDEEASVESLGLTDGAVVHLRPRADQIPPADFDDLADGLATGLRERDGAWRPEMARWAAAGGFGVVAAAGAAMLAANGPVLPRAVAAGVLAILAMAAAYAFASAWKDRLFATIAAGAGIGYAALAAAIAPNIPDGSSPLELGPAQTLAAVAVTIPVAVIAALVSRGNGPVFAGVVAAAACATAGAAPTNLAGLTGEQGAAITAVLAVLLTFAVPRVALRLARIRTDPVPTRPEELQENIDPEPSTEVLRLAAVADRYMIGLTAGLAATGLVATTLLPAQGWAGPALAVLVALARLLLARAVTSAWQRLLLSGPALAGLLLVAVNEAGDLPLLIRLVVLLAGLPVAAAVLVAVGRHLPDRRMMPMWGRMGDVVQLISIVALLPVLAAVLGLYGAARAMGG
ncbi:type VII secretion integral membrane protein EccD [Paractinoplanes atraurantiacus]|uniref:type VII secretion integral membrane protein EccD n=1 Tax=Paractinoplanes atraurantiacus TaxID=1036182 RepID=UPI0015CEF737|nr:type VII secretion integral membrane protein EccD [Actinoplanes atraurantiacus]